MTSKVLFPSLNEEGWTRNSIKVADNLFSHFITSDFSQTYLFRGEVTSQGYIIHNTINNIPQYIKDTEIALKEYFSKYFNNVSCVVEEYTDTVKTNNFEEEDSKDIRMSVLLSFTDNDNIRHDLFKVLTISNSKVKSVVNYSNYGEVAGKQYKFD